MVLTVVVHGTIKYVNCVYQRYNAHYFLYNICPFQLRNLGVHALIYFAPSLI